MLKLWDAGQEDTWLHSFHVRSALRPWYDEIDTYGHVSNVMFPRYFEFGRLQYFKTIGDPDPIDGVFPFAHIVAEQHVRFMHRVFYDEPLEVLTKITELGSSSAGFEQAIVDNGNRMRAIAKTIVVHVHKHESAPWSNAQREAIAKFEGFQSSSVREF